MRYLPLSDTDRGEMLARIGVDRHRCPVRRRAAEPATDRSRSTCRAASGELEVERDGRLAWPRTNTAASAGRSSSGAGAYKHHVPATVDHLIQRSEFLTSYTPYQPEIAQGTLQYLFEFQTQVAALTGMEVANASMYDGSTACAEAVLMAHRVTRRRKAVLSGGLHPHYAEVVRTLSRMAERRDRAPARPTCGAEDLAVAAIDDDTSCVVVQTPDVFGNLRDLTRRSPRSRHAARARC